LDRGNLNKSIIIRITQEQNEFLKNSEYSQTKIFRKAINGLMQKEKLLAA